MTVGGADRGAVGYIKGVERALQILMVFVLVRFGVFHGEEGLRQLELLRLLPGGEHIVGPLELDASRVQDGRYGCDVVEPLDSLAGIGIDALVTFLKALELGEGWEAI